MLKNNNNNRLSYKLYSREESNISTYLAEQPNRAGLLWELGMFLE